MPASWEVDLKWSLWTTDPSIWGHCGEADAFERARDAFAGRGEFRILTAPRKEIRFGEVEISKGRAEVWFFSEFDDGGRVDVRRTVTARTFEDLMRGIDDVEAELIALEDAYIPTGES